VQLAHGTRLLRCILPLMLLCAIAVLVGCSLGGSEDGETPGSLAGQGWSAFEAGYYARARDRFEDALDLDAHWADAYNGLGWSLAKLDDLDGAVENFDAALDEDESLRDPLAGKAIVCVDSDQSEEAVSAAVALLAADAGYVFSHDPSVSAADIRMVKAKAHCNLGQFAEALHEVQEIEPSFYVNVSTADGRRVLLEKIEELINTV
jgi:tetratricopeptide (TPR) repeat protein